jgi:threonine aldolase
VGPAIETNIVNLDVDVEARAIAREAATLGVLVSPTGPRRLRAVTHLDVTRDEILAAARLLERALAQARRPEGR